MPHSGNQPSGDERGVGGIAQAEHTERSKRMPPVEADGRIVETRSQRRHTRDFANNWRVNDRPDDQRQQRSVEQVVRAQENQPAAEERQIKDAFSAIRSRILHRVAGHVELQPRLRQVLLV